MTINATEYTVTFSHKELDYLVTALQGEVVCVRERVNNPERYSPLGGAEDRERLRIVREMRDSLSPFVGRHYTGENA